ncbi:TatD family hydrolase [Ketobacter sp.]|uniref:TatD family hydrolase n=1 Tax=Ketobacter sp. TaxID=2083498 RepID=UPI00269799EF
MELVDIGVNLTDKAFANDLDQVLVEARQAGVNQLIVTGTNLQESRQAVALCRQHGPGLWCTAGVHPHNAKEWSDRHYQALKALLEDPLVVAMGETGLDFNRNFSPPQQQLFAFEEQLKLAAETGMPLFLHERDAHEAQLKLLQQYRSQLHGGVIHCFTGSAEELDHYLELDLYVGITGWICDERRGLHLQELIHRIPPQRLLLETDSPYLLPRTLRPKPKSRRNEPRHLAHITEQIAPMLGTDPTSLAAQTTRNAATLFKLENP